MEAREPTKKLAIGAVCLLVLVPLSVVALSRNGPFPAPGKQVSPAGSFPKLALLDLRGDPTGLDVYKDRVVLLDVWATWCGPCIEAFPRLQSLHDQFGSKGLTVVGVSIDQEGLLKVPAFLKSRRVTYPMLLDGGGENSLEKALQVTSLPTLILLNRQGRIVKRWTGQPGDEELKAAVIRALQEQ